MASFALFAWPIVGVVLFLVLGTARGLIWTFLLGYLLLPEAFELNVPGLPPYHKTAAISLACVLGVVVTAPGRRKSRAQDDPIVIDPLSKWLVRILLALLFIVPIFTILTNGEPLFYGPISIPGLNLPDYVSMTWGALVLVVPFLLARQHLADEASHRMLLKALVICGLCYSLLMLVEIRLSPQLHYWVYGYFQHQWAQHIRGGGYRPIVFLEHGLAVGFFLFSASAAAIAFMRSEMDRQRRLRWFLAAVWLSVVMAFSRNLGALALGILLLPILALSPRRLQIWMAVGVAIVFLAYPALRQAQIIPVNQVVELAEGINPVRAASLRYRIDVEDAILERAAEKPLFGWGLWARYRVFDEYGRDTTTVDGFWVRAFGERGWLGYLGLFGFFTLPILLLARNKKAGVVRGATIGVVFILCGYLIYIIPNSGFGVFIWLIAGAVAGFAERRSVSRPEELPSEDQQRPTVGYTRFPSHSRRTTT